MKDTASRNVETILLRFPLERLSCSRLLRETRPFSFTDWVFFCPSTTSRTARAASLTSVSCWACAGVSAALRLSSTLVAIFCPAPRIAPEPKAMAALSSSRRGFTTAFSSVVEKAGRSWSKVAFWNAPETMFCAGSSVASSRPDLNTASHRLVSPLRSCSGSVSIPPPTSMPEFTRDAPTAARRARVGSAPLSMASWYSPPTVLINDVQNCGFLEAALIPLYRVDAMLDACGASCAMAGAPPESMERTALGTADVVPAAFLHSGPSVLSPDSRAVPGSAENAALSAE